MKPVKILLVDDHALLRGMLSERLGMRDDFEIVGAASDAGEALRLANDTQPDIVVMDIDMPGLSCFDAAKRLLALYPQTRIIFLSAYFHDHYIEQALRAGAVGYLTKSESPQRIEEAVREVAAGGASFSDEVRSRIVIDEGKAILRGEAMTRSSNLTDREIEVLRYLSRGLAKKEVAEIMHLSVKTIEKHTYNVMQKLDIHDRVELALYAIREGLAEA